MPGCLWLCLLNEVTVKLLAGVPASQGGMTRGERDLLPNSHDYWQDVLVGQQAAFSSVLRGLLQRSSHNIEVAFSTD